MRHGLKRAGDNSKAKKWSKIIKSSVVVIIVHDPSRNILLKGLLRSLLTPRLILLIVSSRSPRPTLLWRASDASEGIGGGGVMRRPFIRGDFLISFVGFAGTGNFAGDGSLLGVDALSVAEGASFPFFRMDVGPADMRSILDCVSWTSSAAFYKSDKKSTSAHDHDLNKPLTRKEEEKVMMRLKKSSGLGPSGPSASSPKYVMTDFSSVSTARFMFSSACMLELT